MANDIVLSAASRSNLLSLQNTQKSIDVTQLRLATGKKVNSALDNPQSFFQATSLSNRASDLTRLLDGIGQSIRTIEEADKGITALTSLVEQAGAIASEAQSEILASTGFAQIVSTVDHGATGALVAASAGIITANDDLAITVTNGTTGAVAVSGDINIDATDTIYNIAAEINASAVGTLVRATINDQGRLSLTSLVSGSTIRLSDGTGAALGVDGFAYLGLDHIVGTEETVAGTRAGGTAVAGRTLYSQVSATVAGNGLYEASATLGAEAGFLDNAGADSVQVIMNIDGVSTTVNAALTDTNTIQELVDSINTAVGEQVTASFNTSTGRIELKAAEDVGYIDLQFQAVAASTIDFGFAGTPSTVGSAVPTDVVLGAGGNDISERFNFTGSSANLAQYQADFNEIRSQIDALIEDANYRGVNLLAGDDLTTFFNEDRSNTLVTDGVDFSAQGLGIDVANFTNASNVQTAVENIRNALDAVRNFGSSISNDLAIIQTRQTFTSETINTLKAGAADLVNADLNEEGANLLALQTAQQLGVTSLSLASQSQQSVLRLF